MGIAKGSIGNSSFIGAFCLATDMFSILSRRATDSEEKLIRDTLETRVVRSTVDGSDLVGIYIVANSHGILIPEIARMEEVNYLKEELKGVNVGVIDTDLNALRNNILVNDKVAFINSGYGRKEMSTIEDVLGVEVIKRNMGGFETVGANNIITNRGMVISNSASDDDIAVAKRFFNGVTQTTANLGSSSIGLCVVANSKGMVVGNETTGFEMARLGEGLELE
jgi:translation initiation factor 6